MTPQDPCVQTVLTWCHQRLCIFGLYGTIQMLLLLLLPSYTVAYVFFHVYLEPVVESRCVGGSLFQYCLMVLFVCVLACICLWICCTCREVVSVDYLLWRAVVVWLLKQMICLIGALEYFCHCIARKSCKDNWKHSCLITLFVTIYFNYVHSVLEAILPD